MCPIDTFIHVQPLSQTQTFVNIFIGKDIPMQLCYRLKFQNQHPASLFFPPGHHCSSKETKETQL